MSNQTFINAGVFLIAMLMAEATSAQQTRVFSYDARGRMTSSGVAPTASTSYRFDRAGNRKSFACCEAIGASIDPDGFDPFFYLLSYPDIRAANVDPYQHWLSNGYSEVRDPNRFFNTTYYRATYGVPASVNALTDYHTTGWRAGRNPSSNFSTSRYLAAYPDVAAADIDPLWHFLAHGYFEGRTSFPVI